MEPAMIDISDLTRQGRAALAQPDNRTHRRDMAKVLAHAPTHDTSEAQRVEAVALVLLLGK